jgi:thiol-disulfide isomerase/thioredoxin
MINGSRDIPSSQGGQRAARYFSLPLINVFRNPPAAFREIKEQPAVLLKLAFFFVVSMSQWYFMGKNHQELFQRIAHLVPLLGNRLVFPPVAFALGVLLSAAQALVVHASAQFMMEPYSTTEASYKGVWSVTIFLNTIFSLLTLLHFFSRYLLWGLVLLHWTWYVWGLSVLYDFSLGRSLGTWFLSLIFTTISMMLLGLVGFYTFMRPRYYQKYLHKTPLHEAHRAADFNWSLETLDGRRLSMKEWKGKVIFLNFWATWCFPCRMEMPSIQKLYDQLKANPHIVFAIVSQESPETVQKFLKQTNYTFPMYVSKESIPAPFVSPSIPITFIISPEGQIVAEHSGATQWDTDGNSRFLQELVTSSTTALSAVP